MHLEEVKYYSSSSVEKIEDTVTSDFLNIRILNIISWHFCREFLILTLVFVISAEKNAFHHTETQFVVRKSSNINTTASQLHRWMCRKSSPIHEKDFTSQS